MKPFYVKEIVEVAENKRQQTIHTKLDPAVVTLDDEMLKALTAFPVKPGKKT